MKRAGFLLFLSAILLLTFQAIYAQDNTRLALVMTADGPIMPAMREYIKRGIDTAERRNAEVLIITFQAIYAQDNTRLALVMTADGPIMPAMREYIKRGIDTAERRNAEVLIIQLNTPGGDLLTTLDIIASIRSSTVPVVVYVAPKNAIA